MIDAIARNAIEEQLAFLQPGGSISIELNGYEFLMVRLCGAPLEFVVVCRTTSALVASPVGHRRVYLVVDKYATEQNDLADAAAEKAEQEARIAKLGIRGAIPFAPRRAPAAGEVLPPEQRASHWGKPIDGIDDVRNRRGPIKTDD